MNTLTKLANSHLKRVINNCPYTAYSADPFREVQQAQDMFIEY